jgi:hypothetical protein
MKHENLIKLIDLLKSPTSFKEDRCIWYPAFEEIFYNLNELYTENQELKEKIDRLESENL